MQDYRQAEMWVAEYCREECWSRAKTNKLVKAVSDLKTLASLDPRDRFMIWDALGLCDERNDVSEKVYQFLSLHLSEQKTVKCSTEFLAPSNDNLAP